MKKINLFFGVIGLIFLVGCSQVIDDKDLGNEIQEIDKKEDVVLGEEEETEVIEPVGWKETKLKDVRTGEEFRISDFSGKPVLLESFAVWCPTCTKQQNEIKKLHEDIGDKVVSITLDTDPNEDEAKVLEHVNRNGFDWLYAVAPVDMTRALVDEFGVGFVNAPQAPVLLIREDGAVKLLKKGVKSASELKSEIEGG